MFFERLSFYGSLFLLQQGPCAGPEHGVNNRAASSALQTLRLPAWCLQRRLIKKERQARVSEARYFLPIFLIPSPHWQCTLPSAGTGFFVLRLT